MLAVESLSSRIDGEFAVLEKKFKDTQIEALREWRQRRQRIQQLDKVFETLGEAWKPRLATLLKKFGERVQVTPRLTPSSREATFEFLSQLGRVRLKFSASTDRDVRKVILGYDLEIIPVYFRYQPHAELEFPLDAVDEAAAARRVDDRIVDFVRAYLSMAENEFDAQEHMVEEGGAVRRAGHIGQRKQRRHVGLRAPGTSACVRMSRRLEYVAVRRERHQSSCGSGPRPVTAARRPPHIPAGRADSSAPIPAGKPPARLLGH
jgi:hypothetical protein